MIECGKYLNNLQKKRKSDIQFEYLDYNNEILTNKINIKQKKKLNKNILQENVINTDDNLLESLLETDWRNIK